MEVNESEETPVNEQESLQVQDQNEFDVNAFMEGDDSLEEQSLIQNESSTEQEHSESELSESTDNVSSDDEEMDWSMFSDVVGNEVEPEQQQESQEESQSEQSEEPAQQEEATSEPTDVSYNDFSEDLGFEVKSREDIVSKFKSLQEENQDLRRNGSSYLNDKAKSYQKLSKMDDESLFKVMLKGKGLSDEKVLKYTEEAKSNGTLERESDVFRAKINQAIDVEISSEQERQARAAQEAEQEDKQNRKVVRDYINSQEEMFGMKMAKDPEKLKATRKELSSYILDGKFMKEISASPDKLSEVAWLWKHRDVIMKGFQNKGMSQGKAEFMKQLKNPSPVSQSNSRRELSDDGNFNAEAFMAD